jgi:hypothetical protein
VVEVAVVEVAVVLHHHHLQAVVEVVEVVEVAWGLDLVVLVVLVVFHRLVGNHQGHLLQGHRLQETKISPAAAAAAPGHNPPRET